MTVVKSNDFTLAALLVVVFVDEVFCDVVEFGAGINTISLLWISEKSNEIYILCFQCVITRVVHDELYVLSL